MFIGGAVLYVGWVCLQAYYFYVPGIVSEVQAKVEMVTPTGKSMSMITFYTDVGNCAYRKIVEGKKVCLMASGKPAYVGAIACPRTIKLGTTVEFDGETHICEDRYSADFSDRFDVFVGYGKEATDLALKLGVHRTLVRVNQ